MQIYAFDADGNLTKRIRKKDTTDLLTEFRRDALGRIATVLDPRGNQWTYLYDRAGQRTDVHDPDLGHWTYTYDASGRLVTQTDARAIATTLTYDELSRVGRKCVSGGTPAIATEITANSYDQSVGSLTNRGRLTASWRGVGPAGAACSSDPASKISRNYAYDVAGRRTSDTYVDVAGSNRTISFTYYADGSLTSYFFFQLKYVASEIPAFRQISATV